MLCGTASTRSRANRRGIGTRGETIADGIHIFSFEKENEKEKRRGKQGEPSFGYVFGHGGEKGGESRKFTRGGAVPSILSQHNHLPVTLGGQRSSIRTMMC